jgi:ferritin-like metal-binding protein YciE
MSASTLRELYLNELADLYDAERRAILLVTRLAEEAQHADLRAALTHHSVEARLHLERIQLILTHWGEERRPRTSAGLAGIVQEADDRLNDPATGDARDAAIIGIAQRVAHYEIAAYGAARIFARWLNRLDDARLLEETIAEQQRAERRLIDVADARESTISAA